MTSSFADVRFPFSQPRPTAAGKLREDRSHIQETAGPDERTGPTAGIWSVVHAWMWELLGVLTAMGVLGAIYGICRRYDSQRLPEWRSATINLNSLIAILSTILRNLLVFVLAEVIGQAKWAYFLRTKVFEEYGPPRRLIAMDQFDSATRGLTGALRLWPIICTDISTSIAVVLLVSSLGMGSFVQQATQTQSCHYPMDTVNASLPISRNLTAGLPGDGDSVQGPLDLPNLESALSSAVHLDNGEVGPPVIVTCLTGNCTFSDTYHTLGVCHSCVDTSSLISSRNWSQVIEQEYSPINKTYTYRASTNHSLPNGIAVVSSGNLTQLVAQATWESLDWADSLVGPETRALSKWAFANVSILTSNWHRGQSGFTEYIAATCTIYPCLRSYTSVVTNGELRETLAGTIPVAPNVVAALPSDVTIADIHNIDWLDWSAILYGTSSGTHFQAVAPNCSANNQTVAHTNKSLDEHRERLLLLQADFNGNKPFIVNNITAPRECIYGMDVVAWSDFNNFMIDEIFNGTCDLYYIFRDNTTQLDCHDGKFWLAEYYNMSGTTAAKVMDQMGAFTDRLSNKMRMGLLNEPFLVSGQVLATTVCNSIDYKWLLFPLILVGTSSGLLLWTLLQSYIHRSHELIWKSSTLPLLFYADRFETPDVEDRSADTLEILTDGPGIAMDLAQMSSEAKQRKARFRKFETGVSNDP
ncbi:hypothetical protein F5Y12DRAFT_553382 [Xylaria sp. FL1777]|nr:hypothetical protein F5Y12DRAFT_553382 [Xylaria sp. FL1777]